MILKLVLMKLSPLAAKCVPYKPCIFSGALAKMDVCTMMSTLGLHYT